LGDEMSRSEKLLARLLRKPKDFTFAELETLLLDLDFSLSAAGRTSGSAVRFIQRETGQVIRLHKPRPSPELKEYVIKYVIAQLKQGGYING